MFDTKEEYFAFLCGVVVTVTILVITKGLP